MYSVSHSAINNLKLKTEVYSKPLPAALRNYRMLISLYTQGDYTYSFSDDRESYRNGKNYHDMLNVKFEEAIASCDKQEDKDLLTKIIKGYASPDRYSDIPELTHPDLGNKIGFVKDEKFINEISLNKLDAMLNAMNALAPALEELVAEITSRYGNYTIAHTLVPHGVLRENEYFSRYCKHNAKLINPVLIKRIEDTLLNPVNFPALKGMASWYKHVGIYGGHGKVVEVSIHAKEEQVDYAVIGITYGLDSFSVIIPTDHPLLAI